MRKQLPNSTLTICMWTGQKSQMVESIKEESPTGHLHKSIIFTCNIKEKMLTENNSVLGIYCLDPSQLKDLKYKTRYN
jgi:nitrogen regulatory protein PII